MVVDKPGMPKLKRHQALLCLSRGDTILIGFLDGSACLSIAENMFDDKGGSFLIIETGNPLCRKLPWKLGVLKQVKPSYHTAEAPELYGLTL
jgi:hypothetical protein